MKNLIAAADTLSGDPKTFPVIAGILVALRRVIGGLLPSNDPALQTPDDSPLKALITTKDTKEVDELMQNAEKLFRSFGSAALLTSKEASSASLQLVASEICMGLRCFVVDGRSEEAVSAMFKVFVGGVKSFIKMSVDQTLLDGLGQGAQLAVRYVDHVFVMPSNFPFVCLRRFFFFSFF